MSKKMLLYIVWCMIFVTEMGILINYLENMMIGFIIYVCCLFASVVLLGFAEEIKKDKKIIMKRKIG